MKFTEVESACDVNFSFRFRFDFESSRHGVMILVSIDRSNASLFSPNSRMYINEDFQLDYIIHRDPMCDLSIPLMFLSSVLHGTAVHATHIQQHIGPFDTFLQYGVLPWTTGQ